MDLRPLGRQNAPASYDLVFSSDSLDAKNPYSHQFLYDVDENIIASFQDYVVAWNYDREFKK